MPLAPGTRLGPYEIGSPIGKGGMGEVYRARDTKLDRDVAIKVLPEEFAKDDERLARFEREAKLLASLNHPNIASIYGLEESDGVKALVLELVEGPTLAERIAEGPIPIEEALPIARQIAEALEAGHEAGIVHRDLKPANVKVKEDGNVKVLDYGLAKALEGNSPRGTESELSQSPTLTRQGTQIGVILGTAAYMSPEQAKGKRVDKRTDIWAFGAVLYEMLTARRAFPGDDTSEALAAVIRAEPALGALPTSTPPAIRRVLRRCFVKNSTERLADIADARIEIAEASTDDAQVAPVTATWQKPRWLALAGVVLVALGFAIRNPSNVDVLETTVTRYVVTLPDGDILHMSHGGLALSPDGQKLAYVATRNRVKQLFVRQRDRVTAEPVPGTENAASPFFSPDGEWLAFFDGRSLMKVSLTGGAPQKVCDAKLPRGASWGVDDTIVYGTFTGAFSVPASGGAPTRLSSSGGWFPFLLLDGESVLLSGSRSAESGRRPTYVYNLVTGEERYLIDGSMSRVIPGYLIVARGTSLWAAPFDADRVRLKGPAVPIVDGVSTRALGLSYDIAADGSLAFVPGAAEGHLTIVDPSGGRTELAPLPQYHSIRLSPDGRKVLGDGEGGEIWVYDMETGTRLTVAARGFLPVWSPDGASVIYGDLDESSIVVRDADGSGEDERILFDEDNSSYPTSWSPDGQWIATDLMDTTPEGSFDIHMLSPSGDSRAFLETPANEFSAMFSPDGRWVAYQSDQSGRNEVYVEPFPGPGERIAVSARGGTSPVWSSDGTELYFRQDTAVIAVTVDTTDGFSVSPPRYVVDGQYWLDPTAHVTFGVFPDGKLLMIDTGQANEIHVVLNWVEELQRLVPTDN